MANFDFDLDAAVSVSDLRGDDWPSRLAKYGQLRVERRGDVVGILVSRKQWQSLKALIADFERRLETAEDEFVGRLIESREGVALRHGEELRTLTARELQVREL